MSFTSLGLMPELVRALEDRKYVEPTPVQARVIPEILAGRDMLAGAQTGTGKTAGFALPILQRLNAAPNPLKSPRCLILVPTRELAAQVGESVRGYGKYLPWLKTAVVFGGVNINSQIHTLAGVVDVLVATPGRLLDHAQQRTVDLSRIEILVLDEADRMLDMGFIADIRRIIKLLPRERQNLMFSATYSDDIRRLAQTILRNPAEVEVARRNAPIELVEQRAYMVAKDQKRALLSHLIHDGDWSQVLVFTRTKHGANRLTKQLEQDGIEASAIHGNKSQAARTKALADFKAYRIRALVATEVAARGLDIKELPHVVNYELPNVPEDYVHRIGRTGRAGSTGIALSLVSSDEAEYLRDIEKLLRKKIETLPVPAFKPSTAQPLDPERAERAGEREYRPEHDPRRIRAAHGARPSGAPPAGEQARRPPRRRGGGQGQAARGQSPQNHGRAAQPTGLGAPSQGNRQHAPQGARQGQRNSRPRSGAPRGPR